MPKRMYQYGRKCSVSGCEQKHHAKGFCAVHHSRWKKYGDPNKALWFRGDRIAFIKKAANYSGNECLLWPFGRDQHGHATVFWKGKKRKAARVVCELTNGRSTKSKPEAAHNCGNGHLGCLTPKHLRWDTHAGNMADMVRHGTSNRGQKNPNSKLSEQDVKKIRELLDERLPQNIIAKRFKVDPSSISNIFRGRNWEWL